jgi:flagellum-specific ATP synthase
MIDIVPKSHFDAAARLKEIVATYRRAQDLINIGAYVKGTNPKIDHAIDCIDDINAFLRQDIGEFVSYGDSIKRLQMLAQAPAEDDEES